MKLSEILMYVHKHKIKIYEESFSRFELMIRYLNGIKKLFTKHQWNDVRESILLMTLYPKIYTDVLIGYFESRFYCVIKGSGMIFSLVETKIMSLLIKITKEATLGNSTLEDITILHYYIASINMLAFQRINTDQFIAMINSPHAPLAQPEEYEEEENEEEEEYNEMRNNKEDLNNEEGNLIASSEPSFTSFQYNLKPSISFELAGLSKVLDGIINNKDKDKGKRNYIPNPRGQPYINPNALPILISKANNQNQFYNSFSSNENISQNHHNSIKNVSESYEVNHRRYASFVGSYNGVENGKFYFDLEARAKQQEDEYCNEVNKYPEKPNYGLADGIDINQDYNYSFRQNVDETGNVVESVVQESSQVKVKNSSSKVVSVLKNLTKKVKKKGQETVEQVKGYMHQDGRIWSENISYESETISGKNKDSLSSKSIVSYQNT